MERHWATKDLGPLLSGVTTLGSEYASGETACMSANFQSLRDTLARPSSSGRAQPADLHLCMHHYRASRRSLQAVGATVFDGQGAPI